MTLCSPSSERCVLKSSVHLFGTLSDVGGLLEQDLGDPDVEHVQGLEAENAKSSLEEIPKRSVTDKTVCQREKKEW